MQLNALIGKKTYQKQGFLQDGTRVPLTGVVVAGNIITQIKSQDKEGYNSIQLGIDAKKRFNKAILGHVKNATLASKTSREQSAKIQDSTSSPVSASASQANSSAKTSSVPKYFKEVRVEDISDAVLGSEVQVAEVFEAGDIIDVTGVSKGKGWAGGVKRYHFRGGPRTHGQSDRERAPGSIGQTTTPGRVYKGKKMAGRMGSDTVTVKNLEVIEITDDGILLVKGLVPGRVNSLLMVKKVGANKKYQPLYKEVEEEIAQEAPIEETVAKTAEENVETKETTEEVVQGQAPQAAEDKPATEEAVVVEEKTGGEVSEVPAREKISAEVKEEAKEDK